MAKGFIHTVYENDEWVNKFEADGQLGLPHGTKEEAVAAGGKRAKADQTEHVIHNQEGTIDEHKTYGR